MGNYCTNQISDTWRRGGGLFGLTGWTHARSHCKWTEWSLTSMPQPNKNTQQGISLAASFSLNQSDQSQGLLCVHGWSAISVVDRAVTGVQTETFYGPSQSVTNTVLSCRTDATLPLVRPTKPWAGGATPDSTPDPYPRIFFGTWSAMEAGEPDDFSGRSCHLNCWVNRCTQISSQVPMPVPSLDLKVISRQCQE